MQNLNEKVFSHDFKYLLTTFWHYMSENRNMQITSYSSMMIKRVSASALKYKYFHWVYLVSDLFQWLCSGQSQLFWSTYLDHFSGYKFSSFIINPILLRNAPIFLQRWHKFTRSFLILITNYLKFSPSAFKSK